MISPEGMQDPYNPETFASRESLIYQGPDITMQMYDISYVLCTAGTSERNGEVDAKDVHCRLEPLRRYYAVFPSQPPSCLSNMCRESDLERNTRIPSMYRIAREIQKSSDIAVGRPHATI